MTHRVRTALTGAIILIVTIAAIACASLASTPAAQSARRQAACVADASTDKAAEDCMCRVRADYPGPQCDGGVNP